MTNRPITPAEAHLVATAVTLAAAKGETVCRAVANTFSQDQLAAAKEVLEEDLAKRQQ